jgi:hypothetical protein
MRKLIGILLFVFWGMGNLLRPDSCMHTFSLHDMYAQCSLEDPDLTPLDFVFGHLLNLEDVMTFFEGEEPVEDGERPHAPFRLVQTVFQYVVPVARPFNVVHPAPVILRSDKVIHPLCRQAAYCFQFHSDILRPPIV